MSDTLLQVENLNLTFHTRLYQGKTLRDAVVNVVQDPLGFVMKEKDRLHVLKNINFEVRRGDRIGILGVNGVGKTSLCRCIAGIFQPTSGAVRTSGQVRAIFDTTIGVYPELTGRENAYLLAEFMYPEIPEKHEELIEEALEFSELGAFLDAPFRIYSNGMQARLCLSLVSCMPTDLLILDEVFEGADAFFKEKISQRILKMIEGSGAVIFVSHSADQVARVCNRVLVLDKGELIFDGSPQRAQEIYAQLG